MCLICKGEKTLCCPICSGYRSSGETEFFNLPCIACNGTSKIDCYGEHDRMQEECTILTTKDKKPSPFNPIRRWKIITTDQVIKEIFIDICQDGTFWGKTKVNDNDVDMIGSYQFASQLNQLTIRGISNHSYFRTTIMIIEQKNEGHIGLGDDGIQYLFIPYD